MLIDDDDDGDDDGFFFCLAREYNMLTPNSNSRDK